MFIRFPLTAILILFSVCACCYYQAYAQAEPSALESSSDFQGGSATGVPDLSQVGTGEIERSAVALTGSKRYAEAVPYLRELLNRLSDSTQAHIVAKLEGFRYFLALGLVSEQDWLGAITAFEEFFKEHPGSRRERLAREFYADSLAAAKRHQEAAEQYQLLLTMNLQPIEALQITDRLVASLLAGQQWEKAIPFLTALLEKTPRTGNQREVIATALTRCYIETNQPAKVLEILPSLLSRAPRARLSVEFNLALLEAGDRLLAANEPFLALLFYQLVKPYEQLAERIARLIEENNEAGAASQAAGDLGGWMQSQRVASLLSNEKTLLEATPNYTAALAMRIAQTYFSTHRIYEAMWCFWNIFQDHPDSEFGADACYGAYALSNQLEQLEKAKEAGLYYLSTYPEGVFWDDVSLGIAQILMRTRQFELLDDFVDTVLTAKPEHPEAGMLLYLQGYGRFQREMFAESRQSFDRVITEYPGSSMAEAALYWKGMTWLFTEEYDKAQKIFENYLERHPNSEFSEDATFRIGVCRFANEDFEGAASQFSKFLRKYPNGPLSAEAHNFLGDSLGAKGRLKEAEQSYNQAIVKATRQGQIDHAAFQIGKIMEAQSRWQEMEEFFAAYLDKYGTKGDYSQAIHRRGFALTAAGETEKSQRIYWDAIQTYGGDPDAAGIDLITSAYLDTGGDEAIKQVQSAIQSSKADKTPGGRRFHLRLQAALAERGLLDEMPRIDMADVDHMSPATLVWVGEKSSDLALAEAAIDRLLAEYGRSQWAISGWLARGEQLAAKQSYSEAEEAFLEARRLQPLDERAGFATLRAGDMRRWQKKTEQALEAYEEVLQVREWRGPLWPQALYSIGETYLEAGNPKLAYPYFQRIFLLYRNFPDFAAKAYLQCAEISLKLGLKGDALRTLAEMMEQPDMQEMPEMAVARQRFEEIQ